jgi:uncharacterized protein YidB (DUF937 family)
MDDLTNSVNQMGGSGSAGAGGADPTAMLGGLAQALQGEGGIDGLLGKLRAAGLGDQVDSWISTGQNQGIAPSQLGAALGPDTLDKISTGTGIDIAALLPMLAAFLPQIIDMLTPDGATPAGGLNGAAGSLPDLGGLLGGLGGMFGEKGG